MRFPALPGQEARNARVNHQGRVGTPAFRRNILGTGTTIAVAIILGFACLITDDTVLNAVGFVCLVGALLLTWVFIPVLILHQSERRRRRSPN
jgi:hypothetical protein